MVDKNEITNSVIKSLFAAIPYAGQALSEMLDYRSKIKQNRLKGTSI